MSVLTKNLNRKYVLPNDFLNDGHVRTSMIMDH